MSKEDPENTVDPDDLPDPDRPTLASFFWVETFKWGFVVLACYLLFVKLIWPVIKYLWDVTERAVSLFS